jgi:hypothetical protein
MNQQSFWQCLSVQEFFNNSNWDGQKLAAEGEIVDSAIVPTSLLCLSLEEFLKRSNWEGKAIFTQSSLQQNQKKLSLTLSVGEFFQLGLWEDKQGNISLPSPKKSTSNSNPIPSQNQSINIDKLSDLF